MGDTDTIDVVFAEATLHQRQLSWESNGASWAPPMSLEAYLGRELALSQTALSRDGGTRYYILQLRSDVDTVVSGCEVTWKTGLVADVSGVREVKTYGIASVFTPQAFRGRGLASRLMREVAAAMDRDGAEYGALYSDIGRVFYTRLGWHDVRTPQLIIRLGDSLDPTVFDRQQSGPKTLTLDDEAVARLCELDTAQLQRKFARLAASGDGKTHVTFLPTYTQMSWHFTRDAYVAGVIESVGPRIKRGSATARGVRTEDGSSWLYWDHDLREKKLKVMRLVLSQSGEEGVREVQALLSAAVQEAKNWGLPKVIVWSPGSETVSAATSLWRDSAGGLAVVLEEREDGSIPSLRWKGGIAPGDVVWEDNEYFSWC